MTPLGRLRVNQAYYPNRGRSGLKGIGGGVERDGKPQDKGVKLLKVACAPPDLPLQKVLLQKFPNLLAKITSCFSQSSATADLVIEYPFIYVQPFV